MALEASHFGYLGLPHRLRFPDEAPSYQRVGDDVSLCAGTRPSAMQATGMTVSKGTSP
jgi:hypothetical protein